jgi:signal transduction histidine kinase
MNRRILIPITAPAVVIGALLLAACLVSVGYIDRLRLDLTQILNENVASLQAAEQLEIRVRQLRYHSLLYLLTPRPVHLEPIAEDRRLFQEALENVRKFSVGSNEQACIRKIDEEYELYNQAMEKLRTEAASGKRLADFDQFGTTYRVKPVVDACEDLLTLNQKSMNQTAQENDRLAGQARAAMLLLGLAGPLGGLLLGYGMARALSRSIYQLSVRVQDVAERLERDVGSVTVVADGDLQNLDKQLQHILTRVEEVGERLQRNQRALIRAEQLSAVGQLAASVAHEVRNPLTSVKMLVEAAMRASNRKPLSDADLGVIHGEIARLEETVQGFLDFARPPAPQRRAGELRELVGQALDLVRARARQQGVRIEVENPAQLVLVELDPGQFRTVLINLFLNALDAMPSGGLLRVVLEILPQGGVSLRVEDTGKGIDPAVADRLFTPFASTKPTGTGLGLSISRRVVEEHGGRLDAMNRPGGGACFSIVLPAPVAEKVHAIASSH